MFWKWGALEISMTECSGSRLDQLQAQKVQEGGWKQSPGAGHQTQEQKETRARQELS